MRMHATNSKVICTPLCIPCITLVQQTYRQIIGKLNFVHLLLLLLLLKRFPQPTLAVGKQFLIYMALPNSVRFFMYCPRPSLTVKKNWAVVFIKAKKYTQKYTVLFHRAEGAPKMVMMSAVTAHN